MSNEIELYSRMNDPMAAVEKFGEAIAQSGLYNTPSRGGGMVLAMEMFFTKMSPTQLLGKYHVIMNRLSLKADWIMGEFRNKGGEHRIIHRTAERAEVELKYKGQTQIFSLTFDEIKLEPFVYQKDGRTLKDSYATPFIRTKTLWARVTSDGVSAMCPEIKAGIPATEEIDTEPQEAIKTLQFPSAAVETRILPPANISTAEVKTISVASTAPITDGRPSAGDGAGGAVGKTAEVIVPPTATIPAASQPSAPLVYSPSQLSVDVVNELVRALHGHVTTAMEWMRSQQPPWLTADQGIEDLAKIKASKILKQREAFIRAISGQDAPYLSPPVNLAVLNQ